MLGWFNLQYTGQNFEIASYCNFFLVFVLFLKTSQCMKYLVFLTLPWETSRSIHIHRSIQFHHRLSRRVSLGGKQFVLRIGSIFSRGSSTIQRGRRRPPHGLESFKNPLPFLVTLLNRDSGDHSGEESDSHRQLWYAGDGGRWNDYAGTAWRQRHREVTNEGHQATGVAVEVRRGWRY